MATTSYISTTKQSVPTTFLAGYDFTAQTQTLDISPIYTTTTEITIPYTGNAFPVTSTGFTAAVTSGTDPRTLTFGTDYTVAPPSNGNLVITIDANVLGTDDETANGFVSVTFEFYYERTIQ